MKKKLIAILAVCQIAVMTACGSGAGDVNYSDKNENVTKTETKKSDDADNASDKEATTQNESDSEEKVTLTTTVNVNDKMNLDEKLYSYEMAPDYTGELGDLFDEYKNITISAELKDCSIERFVNAMNVNQVSYQIKCQGDVVLKTPVVENYPNSVELFSFNDINGDGVDEILMASYTESTAGWLVGYAYEYEMQSDGNFKETLLWDYDGTRHTMLRNGLMDEADNHESNPYADEAWTYRDVVFNDGCIEILVDYGMKDGADQFMDYVGVKLDLTESGTPYIGQDIAAGTWPKDK